MTTEEAIRHLARVGADARERAGEDVGSGPICLGPGSRAQARGELFPPWSPTQGVRLAPSLSGLLIEKRQF
jgi:hypothetical protein